MEKKSFLHNPSPIVTVMVQADNPDRIKELIKKSLPCGAEAFGMQLCRMRPEYRRPEVYRELFRAAGDRPVYVTNYRSGYNEGKSDRVLADELVELAECGATLCDIMGDMFDRTQGEFTMSETAVAEQMELIDRLHRAGSEVLMSSHIFEFTTPERVLDVATEHKRRGADISKIVVGADSVAEEIENLGIINMLKDTLGIPFLFLSVGECHILRRIGGEVGCCMYLSVLEHDEFATPVQPLLRDIRVITDAMSGTGAK